MPPLLTHCRESHWSHFRKCICTGDTASTDHPPLGHRLKKLSGTSLAVVSLYIRSAKKVYRSVAPKLEPHALFRVYDCGNALQCPCAVRARRALLNDVYWLVRACAPPGEMVGSGHKARIATPRTQISSCLFYLYKIRLTRWMQGIVGWAWGVTGCISVS